MKNIKFLLFGTGDYYERYKKWFLSKDILALLDNATAKQNTYIDGFQVLAPEDGIKLPFDVIIILSFYVKEMKMQLINLGISENRIFHFYDLRWLIYKKANKKPIKYFGIEVISASLIKKDMEYGDGNDLSRKKVLLLSQDLTLGGPAIALFYGAKILSANGYQVVYASMVDGPLRQKLLFENIPVVVDCNLQIETMKDAEWTNFFSLIICNTINFHVFLCDRDTTIPVIWWLHDSFFFYHGINSELLQSISRTNLYLYSVGPVPAKVMRRYISDILVENLLYGVEDRNENGSQRKHEEKKVFSVAPHKICFVTIGYVEARKGQDILFKAIELLPARLREKAVFFLVGQDTSVMARQLREKSKSVDEVVMTGTVDRKTIDEILNRTDMLVCPSREDPMPTVAAEAMMHGVPCLVSDVTGTAEYIQDGVNGFVFHSEDVLELSEKLRWCIKHAGRLRDIGLEARKIYETQFSMKIFERKWIELVNRHL